MHGVKTRGPQAHVSRGGLSQEQRGVRSVPPALSCHHLSVRVYQGSPLESWNSLFSSRVGPVGS